MTPDTPAELESGEQPTDPTVTTRESDETVPANEGLWLVVQEIAASIANVGAGTR